MGSSSQCIAEGKKPQSLQASDLTEAQRLFDLGCAALRDESFEDATECLSKALEIRYARVFCHVSALIVLSFLLS